MPSDTLGQTAPDTLFEEQILIDILQGIQFHFGVKQHAIPCVRGQCKVMSRIKSVMLQTVVTERLEDVGQQQYICLQINVGIVAERVTTELIPYTLGISVVGFTHVLFTQAVLERRWRRELLFVEHVQRCHVLVREDSFTFRHFELLWVSAERFPGTLQFVGRQYVYKCVGARDKKRYESMKRTTMPS